MLTLFGRKIAWITAIVILLIVVSIIFIALLASVPPVSRDALTHHLLVPKLYLQNGGIHEIPHIKFSYFPMNLDLLYMIPMYFNNDILPKFIHFAFALITAGMIYKYLSRRINSMYGLLGALFFLTLPVIVRLSSTVYVDLGLICFLFASLLYLFQWIESNFKTKYLLFGALFCGLALGTKYNGLVGLFLLGLFVAFVYSRYNKGKNLYSLKSIAWSALFVAVALTVFSPWMIRNVVWTGNPVYPLYNSVFNQGSSVDEQQPETVLEERSRMSHIDVRRKVYGESWTEIALIPLRVFFQGKDDTPKYFDGKTSPFLVLLPIFAFIGGRRTKQQLKTEKIIMFSFAVLFLLYACAQTGIRIRYFAPILPPLVVLSMYGLYNLQSSVLPRNLHVHVSPVFRNCIITGVVAVMLGLNAGYMLERFKKDQPFAYISGHVSGDEYIQAYRPEYASYKYANNNLSKSDKIFGLFLGDRAYYCDIPIEFKIKFLQQVAAEADTAEMVSKNLKKEGFTHLVVNFSLFNYWVQKYSLQEKLVLKEFFDNHTEKIFSQDGFGVLKLK